MTKSLGERKLIFIKSLRFVFLVFFIWQKSDMPSVNFYLPTKNHFLYKLNHPTQDRLSLLNSKRVSHNFTEKLLAKLICL